MPKQLATESIIDLSDDGLKAQAQDTIKAMELWEAYLKGLDDAGLKHRSKAEPMATRTKLPTTLTEPKRKGRPPKTQPAPHVSLAPLPLDPPEAAE